jgi:hypothetical protein
MENKKKKLNKKINKNICTIKRVNGINQKNNQNKKIYLWEYTKFSKQ